MRDFVQRFVFSKLAVTLVGALIVAVLIWFLGPLLGIGNATPLASEVNRALAAVLLPAIMGITASLSLWHQRRENTQLAAAVSEGGAPSSQAAGAQEVQALSNRLREAMDLLKKSRFGRAAGRRWLYQLPWYVIIGPPGSGKTTALVNSGLNFPLSEKFGKRSVQGVGGTRSCDWWFTDEAVLIDTAGRYTSQDSDPGQDKVTWLGFLRLLKKYRRRQPLNGVLVAIGISDLMSASDGERQAHADRIRQRIDELYCELGIRLPVYLLFTKADLIAGFIEFFDDLGREGREAVWGMTFDYAADESEGGPLRVYGTEFDALIGRLDQRLLERMQQEADLERRALVFGFPQQVASLKDLSERFLQETFQPNAFDQSVLLRGVYFTSGTQIGTPLDRVMDAMSVAFGVARETVQPAADNRRSFFLTRLLREVVFGEAGLVSADPRAERQRHRVALAIRAAVAAMALLMGGLWLASFFDNALLIRHVSAAAKTYATQAASLKLDRVDDSDLRPVVPLLDTLRALPDESKNSGTLRASLGLSQAGKLQSQEGAAYRKALGAVLLPRLILRLETQLTEHLSNIEFIHEGLKVYLMLGRQGPLDRELVIRWITLDWKVTYPGDENAALRDDLASHLRALLSAPFPDIVLNGELIERAREELRRVPLAQRAYASITASAQAASLSEWRVSDAAGPAAAAAFVRRSGQPLTKGIPGLYTYNGFYGTFLPLLPQAAKSAAWEGWLLGDVATGTSSDATSVAKLQRDITGLYLQDFAQAWDQLIGDLTIASVGTLDQALRVLNVLSSPESPIRLLVVAAANETWLSRVPTAETPAAGKADTKENTKPARDKLQELLGVPASDPGGPVSVAAQFTDRHFNDLHQLATVPPNSAPNAPLPIDGVIADLAGLYHSISGGASSDSPLQRSDAEAGAAAQLQAGAAQLPQPVQSWVLGVTNTSSSLVLGGAREQLASVWQSSVGRFCRAVTTGRYPFHPQADQDVSLDDFARLFAKGGLIDTFFEQNLKPFVDTSRHPWRIRQTSTTETGLSADTLRAFEQAATIRDSFFIGRNGPGAGFSLLPTTLDDGSAKVVLQTDGQSVTYSHTTADPVRLQWPGSLGSSGAKVTFTPVGSSTPAEIATTGPWAWFRLLDQARVRRLGAERQSLTFAAGGHTANFELRPDSVMNPFAAGLLSQFRCPWPQ